VAAPATHLLECDVRGADLLFSSTTPIVASTDTITATTYTVVPSSKVNRDDDDNDATNPTKYITKCGAASSACSMIYTPVMTTITSTVTTTSTYVTSTAYIQQTTLNVVNTVDTDTVSFQVVVDAPAICNALASPSETQYNFDSNYNLDQQGCQL